MSEANQYMFSDREILELLVKKAGLHEGQWQLISTFGLGAMNAGPSEDQVVPAA
jgi:hypothetical protein